MVVKSCLEEHTDVILLVEDNPGDVRIMREALQQSKKHAHHLNVVNDGKEAMAFLQQQSPYANELRPDLILLDLNLPFKNGYEVLTEIKQDPQLKHIPVVILTTSNSSEDILRTYSLGADFYLVKPADIDQFNGLVKSIEELWLTGAGGCRNEGGA
jgi:two-component system, chemotaxis family, response regulator Rcp1